MRLFAAPVEGLAAAGTVGASTAALPIVTGYGTVLFQLVTLGAWGLVATMTSGMPSKPQEPGYFLGITLIAVLVGFNVAVLMIAPTFPPPSRGPATIVTGV